MEKSRVKSDKDIGHLIENLMSLNSEHGDMGHDDWFLFRSECKNVVVPLNLDEKGEFLWEKGQKRALETF